MWPVLPVKPVWSWSDLIPFIDSCQKVVSSVTFYHVFSFVWWKLFTAKFLFESHLIAWILCNYLWNFLSQNKQTFTDEWHYIIQTWIATTVLIGAKMTIVISNSWLYFMQFSGIFISLSILLLHCTRIAFCIPNNKSFEF